MPWLLRVLVVSGLLGAIAGPLHADEQTRPAPSLVLEVRLEGEAITPILARFLDRALLQAETDQAECLLIVLDTPGGLLDSTQDIVKGILASRVPVVVYVAPTGSARAASAGVFITLAAHVAAMAPGTRIGAAHPVQVGPMPTAPRQPPPDSKDDAQEAGDKAKPLTTLEQKSVNDAAAWARALAELRGRNADWAESAVRESASITAETALQENVIDLIAESRNELLAKIDGRKVTAGQETLELKTRNAVVETFEMWWGEQLLAVISNPNVAFLLLMFGFYGILFEITSPGWGVPGTLGVVCLVLGFLGLSILPIRFVGLALIAVALGLFVAEAFVTSFGALALAGAACLILGGLMLVDTPHEFLQVSIELLVPVAAATAAVTVVLISGILRAYRGRVQTGGEGMLGTEAVATERFEWHQGEYVGYVFAHGEHWKAMSTEPVDSDQHVVIRDRKGLTLIVHPVGDQERVTSPDEPAVGS